MSLAAASGIVRAQQVPKLTEQVSLSLKVGEIELRVTLVGIRVRGTYGVKIGHTCCI